jgi:hypothetical protein
VAASRQQKADSLREMQKRLLGSAKKEELAYFWCNPVQLILIVHNISFYSVQMFENSWVIVKKSDDCYMGSDFPDMLDKEGIAYNRPALDAPVPTDIIIFETVQAFIAGLTLFYTWYKDHKEERKQKNIRISIRKPDGTVIDIYDENQIKTILDSLKTDNVNEPGSNSGT